MKTLEQISNETPELYAEKAVQANNAGKRLAVNEVGELQLVDRPEETLEEKSRYLRQKRDFLLKESDKYMLADFPISPEIKEKYKTYRQLLRDITKQPEFPYQTVFPIQP